MNHFKHESLEGLSTTNIIYDKDGVIAALDGLANAEDILAVLGESIDREDNGFRNIKTRDKVDHEGDTGYQVSLVESSTHSSSKSDPLHQLISDDSGTSQIMEHCHQYLGDNRAWRNGWNPKSYQRHAKATRKAQASRSNSASSATTMSDAPSSSRSSASVSSA